MSNKVQILITGLFCLVFSASAMARQNPEVSGQEMEFWVGEWDLTWTVDSREGIGSNSVTKTLGGAVIHEHFQGIEGPYAGYLGESFTTYNSRQNTFFQTWVDISGGYLDFNYEQENGNQIFSREADFGEGPFKTRMVFYDIQPDSFEWDWERLNPETGEWELQWRIHYQRKEKIEGLSMDQFQWITGRWENRETGDYEVWEYTSDHSSLSGYAVSYNEEKSDSTITEELRITERDGKFIFIAHPISSESPTEFPIISATDKNFVSYNPDHDFPQRVEYHRLDQNRLKAVIKDNQRMMQFNFVSDE